MSHESYANWFASGFCPKTFALYDGDKNETHRKVKLFDSSQAHKDDGKHYVSNREIFSKVDYFDADAWIARNTKKE